MNEEKTLGQVAFEAYNEAKGGKTYDGKPIPPWETLTDETGLAVRAAWEKAVGAAIDADIDRVLPEQLIDMARKKLTPAKGREAALTITKLDEAEMWCARIPWQSP